MDQGVAAAVAGVAGMLGALGGALAGGAAAVRGAKIGAETAAQASRQVVEDQASADHAHWLREQRQQGYSNLLTEAQNFRHAAHTIITALFVDHWRESQLGEVEECARRLREVGNSVALVGPDIVLQAQSMVVDRSLRLEQIFLQSFTDHSINSEEVAQAVDAFDQAIEGFVGTARDVLGGRPGPGNTLNS
ncbi:hypothetical protein [Streptomyces sp. NPDC059171]|uniref:hypothetical protein n=1 Tax=Streptomyces sp. NPDC059171 TaxID=3346755 RepID=UPI0036C0DB27